MNRIPNIIVDLLRSRGVTVIVEQGAWERGADFTGGIAGFMNHHWGSSAAATGAVQAGHCYPKDPTKDPAGVGGGLRTDGRVNCNWFSDRSGDLHLIAAGASNYSSCNGSKKVLDEVRAGIWPGGTARERGLTDSICGNRFFVNMEAEHPGDGSPMPDIQELAIAHLNAAHAEVLGTRPDQNIGHLEWTTRKIDPRWEGPGNRMPAIRAEAQIIFDGGTPTPIPPQENTMMRIPQTIGYGDGAWNTPPDDAVNPDTSPEAAYYVGEAQALLTIAGFIDEKSEDTGAFPVDRKYGNGTADACKGYQISRGLDADGVIGPLTWTELIHG